MPKRLAITGPDRLDFLDYADPPLEPGQVLVKTEIASGKHGTTMALLDNGAFSGQRFDQETRLFLPDDAASEASRPTPESPWNLGTTGVGTIIAVGDAVTRWRTGDRVFGLMDVRETNVCDARYVWALGDIDPLDALCIEPAYVAFHCIRESNLRYGDSVAIVGLGALGLLSVNMALRSGAETVIAVDPIPARRELALKLGADYAFDPISQDAALEAHRMTGMKGVDVAIELSGVHAGLQAAIRCARVAGMICSAGFYQDEAKQLWLGREWHHNRLTMLVPHGCGWGHEPRDYPRWDRQRAYDTLANLLAKGILRDLNIINFTESFSSATDILEAMRNRGDEVIKYAITFD